MACAQYAVESAKVIFFHRCTKLFSLERFPLCGIPVFNIMVSFFFHSQKLTERTAALKKMNFSKKSDADVWMKIMCLEMMSSDDSDMDEDDEVYRVRALPWRKEAVKRMFNTLDNEALKIKTQQAKRQMKRRTEGTLSERPRPMGMPTWAVSDN